MKPAINLVLMSALIIVAGSGPTPAWAQCSTSSDCPASLSLPLPACSPPVATTCTLLPGMLTFLDQTTMTWPQAPSGCPTDYDVAIGDLGCLHGTCSFKYSSPYCFIGNTAALTAIHAVVPALGEGYYYVVRVDDKTWNGSGPGECVDHDTLLIPIPTCP